MSEKISPELFVEIFEISNEKEVPQSKCNTLSIWVPLEYKEKFNQIQAQSKNKFGKFLKKIIMKTIDKVEVDKAA
jgi:hypothetical protein